MLEILIHIFPPIVFVEDFYLSPKLSLFMCFEVFEMLKNLGLLPEKIHPSLLWEIINKCKHVPFFVDWWMRKGSHYITVNELQRRGGPPGLPFLKLLLRMFAKNASLKKSFWKVYVGKVGDHIMFAYLLHVFEV
jgi:hypothetical protein